MHFIFSLVVESILNILFKNNIIFVVKDFLKENIS